MPRTDAAVKVRVCAHGADFLVGTIGVQPAI